MRDTRHISVILTGLLLIATLLGGASCSKKLQMTHIVVEDSIRHYYALLQGTELTLLYRIANVGSTPLVLSDIQPSCGCIVANPKDSYIVPPKKETLLKFTFRGEKNSGYVRHTIRLFGNIAPSGVACLVFDTNVVPPALGSPDYEEMHKERNEFDITTGVKSLVDGNEAERGYWVNADEYSRGYNKYPWRTGKK